MTYAWESKADRAVNEAKGNAGLYSFYKALASPSIPFNDFVVQVKTWRPSFFYFFGQAIGIYEKTGSSPVSEIMKQFGEKANTLPKKAADLDDFFDALKKPLTGISLTWTSIKQGTMDTIKQAKSIFNFGIVPIVLIVGGLYVYVKFFRK